MGEMSLIIYLGHFYLMLPFRALCSSFYWGNNAFWLIPILVLLSCSLAWLPAVKNVIENVVGGIYMNVVEPITVKSKDK